ncbi:MAG: thrombospondin type 3 repeat-containing protein [Phycisphaerae bacterium]|nr:thrombospondin type 3 repeat-containing protein [Phycisphaerae bacterium]
MRNGSRMRWAALFVYGGLIFSTSLFGTCRDFVNSFLGVFVSPGSGGQDTDGDGFTDAQELQAGSDGFDPTSTPNNP